jgi:CBS domain-containing protein
MAGNPQWCLSDHEWLAKFSHWIDNGDPQALLQASIFFDLRGLHGDTAQADALRRGVFAHAARSPRFLHLMAANALRNRPPLGILHDFVTTGDAAHPDTLDLKLTGTTLFVDAARIYSLAREITQAGTRARLHELGVREALPPQDVKAWIDAFQFIQLLRLRHQHMQDMEGRAMDSRINPDDLNGLERRILKEALRQARELQARLALDHQA